MTRIERLAAILLLLQQRPHTSDEIAAHFEVSRRTVLRDVQALSEMGVPVIAREGPGGGYALPAEYHTTPLPLTANEAFLLLLALNALQGLSDLPFREELASLQVKLRAQVPQVPLSSAEGLLSAVSVAGADRAHPAPFLADLMQAAREGRWLRVVYRSLERVSTVHVLPRRVYADEGFWYCAAYCHERSAERTYRVDRVQSLDQPAPDFAPMVPAGGLPYGHESQPHVVARLTEIGAGQIERDRYLWRALKRTDEGILVDFHCPPDELPYFARLFASLGGEVTVLEPPDLRRRLFDLGQKIVEQYQKW